MIRFFCFILLIFWISSSNAEDLAIKFKEINGNDLIANKVYDSEQYFFSLASIKFSKKNNKNILSTKTTLRALKQFKAYYKKNVVNKKYNIIKDKIMVKNAKKIKDRTVKDHHIVVLAIPKKGVTYTNK